MVVITTTVCLLWAPLQNPQSFNSFNSSVVSLQCETCWKGFKSQSFSHWPVLSVCFMTHTHTHTYLLPTYRESFWSCASREPERVFSLKASQMGIRVCARLLFVCVCPFMRGRAARTGDFLCWGRERLGHFIFSSVHCQKGQRSKVRAIGEFRAACRQIGFQGVGEGHGSA